MNTENNKLIAEFMGVETAPYYYLPQHGKIELNYGNYEHVEHFNSDELKYHSDWNWLMEVTQKIESLGFWVEILGGVHNVCTIGKTNKIEEFICVDDEVKIKAVYNACIAFIEWYSVS